MNSIIVEQTENLDNYLFASLFQEMSQLKKLPPSLLRWLVNFRFDISTSHVDTFYINVQNTMTLNIGHETWTHILSKKTIYIYDLPNQLTQHLSQLNDSMIWAKFRPMTQQLGTSLRKSILHHYQITSIAQLPHFEDFSDATFDAITAHFLLKKMLEDIALNFSGRSANFLPFKINGSYLYDLLNLRYAWLHYFLSTSHQAQPLAINSIPETILKAIDKSQIEELQSERCQWLLTDSSKHQK